MGNVLQEKREQMDRLRKEIERLSDKQFREIELPALTREYVGKCFLYINSYGSGTRWPLYIRVLKVVDQGQCIVEQFQITSNDTIEIEPKKHSWINSLGEPISTARYNNAKKRLLKRLRGILS